MARTRINLKLMVPWQVVVDEPVTQVTAEAADGAVSLRPAHVDFTTLLVPGIMSFRRLEDGSEQFAALDRGVLVKRADEVLISARDAVLGDALDELETIIKRTFEERQAREGQLRATLQRLNSDFIRRVVEMD